MKFILSSCIFDIIFLSGVLYCHSHAAVMEQIGSVKLHCPLELQRQGKGKQNFPGCSGHEYLLLYPPIPAAPSEPATPSTWGKQVFPAEAEQSMLVIQVTLMLPQKSKNANINPSCKSA